jgi:hypothetical protein
MEEMRAFIWEKLATPPGESEEDAPSMTYKVSRDPAVSASSPTYRNRKRSLRLPPMDPEIIRWLKQSTQNLEPNEFYNGPTLLVLNGASKSLLESDFYRLARQGKHLDNWAIGLVRGMFTPVLPHHHVMTHPLTTNQSFKRATQQLTNLSENTTSFSKLVRQP